MGHLITIAITQIVWQSSKAVSTGMLDGVDPEVIEELRDAAAQGHRLHAELNIAVAPQLEVMKVTRSPKRCVTNSCIRSVISPTL